MISSHTHVVTGVEFSTALSYDYIPGHGGLPTIHFHTEHFGITVPSVVRTTYTFLMCHNFWILNLRNRFDFQFGQCLTVTFFPTIAFSPLLFEHDDFVI